MTIPFLRCARESVPFVPGLYPGWRLAFARLTLGSPAGPRRGSFFLNGCNSVIPKRIRPDPGCAERTETDQHVRPARGTRDKPDSRPPGTARRRIRCLENTTRPRRNCSRFFRRRRSTRFRFVQGDLFVQGGLGNEMVREQEYHRTNSNHCAPRYGTLPTNWERKHPCFRTYANNDLTRTMTNGGPEARCTTFFTVRKLVR